MNYGTDAAEHVGLYYKIAYKLHERGHCHRWEIEEIVSECYLYAPRVLERFDPSRGFAVSTLLFKSLYLYVKTKHDRETPRRGITNTANVDNQPVALPPDDVLGVTDNALSELIVAEYLDELSEDERRDVVARMNGATMAEISAANGRCREWFRRCRLEDWVRPFAAEWFGIEHNNRDFVRNPRLTSFKGERSGWLTLREWAGETPNRTWWWADCKCGRSCVVDLAVFRRGRVTSCGCRVSHLVAGKWLGSNGNYIGRKFGRLTVVALGPERRSDDKTWLCNCDCGTKLVPIWQSNLGKTLSCGCAKVDANRDPELRKRRGESRRHSMDGIAGRRYGMLVVIGRAHEVGERPRWRCRCDCGNIVDVQPHNLRNKHTRSCGCLRPDPRRGARGRFIKRDTTCKRGGSAQPA